MTCSTPAAAASSSTRAMLAGRSVSRCVSPRQYASWAKVTSLGSLTPGSVSAAASTSVDVIPRPAGEIVRLGATRRGGAWRREQRFPIRLPQQAEHQVATRVEVVHHQQQLAKARLAEVLGQQLGIAPAEVSRIRRLERGAAPQNAPQRGDAGGDRA